MHTCGGVFFAAFARQSRNYCPCFCENVTPAFGGDQRFQHVGGKVAASANGMADKDAHVFQVIAQECLQWRANRACAEFACAET